MNIEEMVLNEYRDRVFTSGKVCRMLDIVCKAEDELFTTLTDEQKDLYRKFNEKEMQLHCEEEEDALLYGFRYAVSLINQLNKIDIGEDND